MKALFFYLLLLKSSSSFVHKQLALTPLSRLIKTHISNPVSIQYSLTTACKSAEAASIPPTSSDNVIKTNKLKNIISTATNIFPLWVILSCVIGNVNPTALQWFTPYITPALALTMLSMGMTLTINDFYRVLKQPQLIAVGFVAQYVIMPLSAYYVAKFMQLGPELSTGLILVGCAPGGTASNLVSLIAQADVPLSVLMTLASTIAAVFMTPFLVTLLTKSYVPVKAIDLVYSTLNVVLAPVFAGIAINTLFPTFCSKVSEYAALPCVLLVSMICGAVTASNRGISIGTSGLKLLISIIAMHTSGFFFGYQFARILNATEQQARTIRFVQYHSFSYIFSMCVYIHFSVCIFIMCILYGMV